MQLPSSRKHFCVSIMSFAAQPDTTSASTWRIIEEILPELWGAPSWRRKKQINGFLHNLEIQIIGRVRRVSFTTIYLKKTIHCSCLKNGWFCCFRKQCSSCNSPQTFSPCVTNQEPIDSLVWSPFLQHGHDMFHWYRSDFRKVGKLVNYSNQGYDHPLGWREGIWSKT